MNDSPTIFMSYTVTRDFNSPTLLRRLNSDENSNRAYIVFEICQIILVF